MEDNKQNKRYTRAQAEAIRRHMAKLDEIRVRVPKGDKRRYQDAAAAAGQSLNQFAITAMDEKIARSDKDPADPAE